VASYTAARITNRVKALGREISRQYQGRRLDVIVTMDRSFVFAADLIRAIDVPVILHFVSEDVRDIESAGRPRREVFFANRATMAETNGRPELKGRDLLVVDAVIDSGVTQEFLLRRLGENKPRSLRLAVLMDKISNRRVALEPDHCGFRTASNELWSGYGLSASNGTGSNSRNLVAGPKQGKSSGPAKKSSGKKKKR
jgi:hypoxanthine phosphoribosyltransferase